jgi:hypothetical protein
MSTVRKHQYACYSTLFQPCIDAIDALLMCMPHNFLLGYDELRCSCGKSVLLPPIACGTRPPPCRHPCARRHACDHPVFHPCHSEELCPPCAVLTSRMCDGGHELRKNIPCYVSTVSCGKPCGRLLGCGAHRCPAKCHSGECDGKYRRLPMPSSHSHENAQAASTGTAARVVPESWEVDSTEASRQASSALDGAHDSARAVLSCGLEVR